MEGDKNLNVIVAVDSEGGIGLNGLIPWFCKEDITFFRDTTVGHTVVMGRGTYESIPHRPLKNRTNIIVSTTWKQEEHSDIIVVSTFKEALEKAPKDKKIFICGGSRLYTEALDSGLCKNVYITKFNASYNCDTFFPYQRVVGDAVSVDVMLIKPTYTRSKYRLV